MKFIQLIVWLLLSVTVSKAQISVLAKMDHIEPDGLDTQGGISLTVSGSTAPYTYTWSPGSYTTQNISNQTTGVYALTVKSASSQTYTNRYSIGYKVKWTALEKCTFSNDSLVSTAASGVRYSKAVSKNLLASGENGWFEYVVSSLSGITYIGFCDSVVPIINKSPDIDFGIYRYSNLNISATENGTAVTLTTNPRVGDVLRVERSGNVITYKINGTSIRTTTVSGVSSKSFRLKAMMNGTEKILNAGCSFIPKGNSYFPNFAIGFPLITHATGSLTADGSVKFTPGITGSFTYSWSTGATTNSVSGQNAGKYKLDVINEDTISFSKYYNIGYKSQWTNLDLCRFRNDSLTSLSNSASIFSRAVSKNTLLSGSDGWFEFVLLSTTSREGYIGFLDSISPIGGAFSDIDYGFKLESDGSFSYYENGTATNYISQRAGDVVRVERVGNTINYKINGVAIKSTTVSGLSSKTFKIKAALAYPLSISNIGCGFLPEGGIAFPNYVSVTPAIQHNTSFGSNDGSVKVTPRIAFSNTYSWTPGGATTSSITSLGTGLYKVSIKDSLLNTSSCYYNVGYKVKWTNFNQLLYRNDSLISSAISNRFSKACSKNTLRSGENGWFEMVVGQRSYDFYTGFSDSLSLNVYNYSWQDIDYGFFYSSTENSLYSYEKGTLTKVYSQVNIGDILRIERSSNTVYYKVNGVTVRSLAAAGLSSKSFKLKIHLEYTCKMANMGCSFYKTDSSEVNNYVELIPLIKHSSGAGINDGSISVKPRLSGLQSYSWQPVAITSATNSYLYKGIYTVTVTDSSANKSRYLYTVGYKTKWTNVSNGIFRNDTLTATTTTTGYNYARTVNILAANENGWFEYVIPTIPSYRNYIGFADSSANNASIFTDIQYGVYCVGTLLYYNEGSASDVVYGYIKAGDVVRIEREGNTIRYRINSEIIRTVTNASIGAKVFRIKAKLGYQNYLTHIGCSFIQAKLTGKIAKEHANGDNRASGIISVSGTGGLAPYRYSCTELADSSTILTGLNPGTYHVRITDARNDTVTLPVTIGYKNDWRLQKNISVSGNTYTNTRTLSDSAGSLVSANALLPNKNGWTEITVNDSTKNTLFGFFGFSGSSLDTSYSASWVKDAAIASALTYADSLVYNRFAGPSKQVSAAFTNLHLVRFHNGLVQIGFKNYTSTGDIYYMQGDVFRVERTGNYISLYKNNVSIATETVSSAPQQLLTALFVSGGSTEAIALGGNTSDTTLNYTGSGNRTMAPCDDSGLNWVYSKSFDEYGAVKSESKIYMDKLGRTIQSQSKMMTENNVLVSEPMYDSFGRAVGQTLPAPVFKTGLCYTPYFIFVKEDSAYTADYFDNAPGVHAGGLINMGADSYNQPGDVNNPVPVYADAFGSLGWYYSDNNYEETLVAADAYPYSRVDFYNDPMGRTKRGGGVGVKHKMGSGHENKIIYTSTPANTTEPTQNELNFIFPHRTYELEKNFSVNTAVLADINKNLQLYKTITLNPDGKDQIAYTNSAGQTIATCITGDGTGCVSHTQVNELYNGAEKSSKKIYIPKSGNASLKLYELTGTTKAYSHIVPVLKDAFTGITLISGVHYTYNSSTGAVTFLGSYLDKSLYLDVSYNVVSHTYHFPANTTVNATVNVDYTQWSAYFYDRKGRLLANVAPKDMACQTVPYPVQRTIASPARMTGSMLTVPDPMSRMPQQQSVTHLLFKLDSVALADTSKMAVLNLNFAADTIFTMAVDTNLFTLFAQKPTLYDSLYLATHPYEPTYADTTSPAPLDSNMLFSNVLDTTTLTFHSYDGDVSFPYYRRIDSLYRTSPALTLVGKSIRYDGYFTVKAWSSDSVSMSLGDTIPFTYDVEAVAYDTLSGGVVCKVTGYQYGLGTDPRHLPGHLLPDIPPDTHTITVAPTFTLMVKDHDPEGNSSSGTGTQDPPTGNDPGAGVLAGHAAISGGILIVPTVPDPIPVHFANSYMYDEYDRLIGSNSEDEGHVDYVYDQKEDKLLFTQNDKQRANGGKFNCVVYDALGRVSQSGEYDAAAGTYQFQTYDQYYKHPVAVAPGKTSVGVAALNNYSTYNDGHILDASHVDYDLPDPSFPSSAISTGYVQRYTGAKVSKTWNSTSTTWYSYDELGRLSASVQNSAELGNKSMVSFYDFRGKLTATAYQYGKSDQFYQGYTYDADERLKKSGYGFTFGDIFNNTTIPTAQYSYYLHGPLKRAVLGGNLQGLDFVYTIGGMLKSVNNPIGTTTLDDPGLDGYAYGPNLTMSPDAFGFSLQYYDEDYVRTGSPIRSNAYTGAFGSGNVSYAGLVRNTIWRTSLPAAAPASYSDALMYEYKYDRLGQLTDARFGTVSQGIGATETFSPLSEYKVDNLGYDPNGNIQSLRRYAAPSTGGNAHLLDDLTYNYHGTLKNRLLQVADASTNPGGYSAAYDMPNQSNSGNYVYNEIGELVQNKQENQGFEYNASGLTTRVYNLANNNSIATFKYNDKGLRHSKTSYDHLGMAVKACYYSYDAGGALVATYTQNLELLGEPVVLQDYTLYGAGRLGTYNVASDKALYELTDHLGNTRAIITKNTTTGLAETVSYTDYYPHGGVLPGRNYQNTLGVPYQYQGQEKDPETNLLNFELRQFDPRIGRWQGPDPMGEFHSPYLAMGNNPVSVTDPTGGYTSDQFWNSYDAPRIGAYSDLNIGVEDRRDGAQINDQPVADPDKHSYMFMTPAERRNVLASNGTSYEQQAAERILGLASVGGYKAKDGSIYTLMDGKLTRTTISIEVFTGTMPKSGTPGATIVKVVNMEVIGEIKRDMPPWLEKGQEAHRVFFDYFRAQGIWEVDKWISKTNPNRPDLVYDDGIHGGVWELKPLGSPYASKEADSYANQLNIARGNRFGTGSSNGAPSPFVGVLMLKGKLFNNWFLYSMSNMNDGAIYWKEQIQDTKPILDPSLKPNLVPTIMPVIIRELLKAMGRRLVF